MVEKTNEVVITPVKRKRGRPRKSETTITPSKVNVIEKKTSKTTKASKLVKKETKKYIPDGKLYICEACNQCTKRCKIQAVKNTVLCNCADFTPKENATLKKTSKLDSTFLKGVIEIGN